MHTSTIVFIAVLGGGGFLAYQYLNSPHEFKAPLLVNPEPNHTVGTNRLKIKPSPINDRPRTVMQDHGSPQDFGIVSHPWANIVAELSRRDNY